MASRHEEEQRMDAAAEALSEAVRTKNRTSISQCLGSGAHFTAQDLEAMVEQGMNPCTMQVPSVDGYDVPVLHAAASHGNCAQVELLLDRRAEVNSRDNGHQHLTALHHAAQKGHFTVVHLLLERGAEARARDSRGAAPLHKAAEAGSVAVCATLVGKGAQVNDKDSDGWTALHCAADAGHDNVIEMLLDATAQVDALDSEGMFPLHRATENGHTEAAQSLLGARADVNARASSGLVPLHYAARRNDLETAKLLLAKGARWATVDDSGRISSEIATSQDLQQLLKEHEATQGAKDKAQVLDVFRSQDTDGGGFISREALGIILSKVVPTLSAADVDAMIGSSCTTESGDSVKVKYEDFVKWIYA